MTTKLFLANVLVRVTGDNEREALDTLMQGLQDGEFYDWAIKRQEPDEMLRCLGDVETIE